MVRIAHEKAQELDKAGVAGVREDIDLTAQLRPVTMDDFWEARKKVGPSPSSLLPLVLPCLAAMFCLWTTCYSSPRNFVQVAVRGDVGPPGETAPVGMFFETLCGDGLHGSAGRNLDAGRLS